MLEAGRAFSCRETPALPHSELLNPWWASWTLPGSIPLFRGTCHQDATGSVGKLSYAAQGATHQPSTASLQNTGELKYQALEFFFLSHLLLVLPCFLLCLPTHVLSGRRQRMEGLQTAPQGSVLGRHRASSPSSSQAVSNLLGLSDTWLLILKNNTKQNSFVGQLQRFKKVSPKSTLLQKQDPETQESNEKKWHSEIFI